jgi:hypothetical protein
MFPSRALVSQAYNPSYSGSRDEKDCSLKDLKQIVPRIYLKKIHHKKGLVEWLKV